jgi:molybdopterin-guanine dinucleotide biosynthesis protein A
MEQDKGLNAIILAGGKNTRMAGQDKAFLEIGGRPVIAALIDGLKALVNEIIIVTANPRKYTGFKASLVSDEIPDKGPLMGIYSGLKISSSKYNFIVACDMPFVKPSLIRYLIDCADGYDIIIPKIDGKFHPLFGIYSRGCIPVMQEMLKEDILKISVIFPKVKTHFLSRQELEKFDKGLVSLININTIEDMIKAKEIQEDL